MRRITAALAASAIVALGAAAPAGAADIDYSQVARNIIPSGQPGGLSRLAGGDHPGADVQRAHPAVRPRHQRRPVQRFQVRAVRARHRRARNGRAGPVPGGHDRARPLRRAPRHRHHARRRRLGGRLDRGRGPRAAAPGGARQLARGRARRARADRDRADREPPELPAQRADRDGPVAPDPGAGEGRARGSRRAVGHRRVHHRHQRLPERSTARPRRRGPATTSTRSTRSRTSSSARAAAARRRTPSSSARSSTGSGSRRATASSTTCARTPTPAARRRSTARSTTTTPRPSPARPAASCSTRTASTPRRRCRPRQSPAFGGDRAARARVQRADGRGQVLHHRTPAARRRPAGRLLLPRPDLRDRHARAGPGLARRHLGPVPRLHADRPRAGLRHDADLGVRRRRGRVRRDAVRPQHAPSTCSRASAGRWSTSTPGRSTARRSRSTRPCTARSSATPASTAARWPSPASARATARTCWTCCYNRRLSDGQVHSPQSFFAAAELTPQTFNSFYIDDKHVAEIHDRAAAAPPQGHRPQPADDRHRQVGVARDRPRQRAPAGHRPGCTRRSRAR